MKLNLLPNYKHNMVICTIIRITYHSLTMMGDIKNWSKWFRLRFRPETLASRGLEEPFFQFFCCVVSVFGSGGKKVLIYIRMYYLENNTVVVVC
jgi:hypothetical protein